MDARQPGVLLFVRFRSTLPDEEITRRYQERMPEFRTLPGLLQKYYAHDTESGEWAGIYLWDSRESLNRFLASDLRKSIPEIYAIQGSPRVEVMDLREALRT